MLLFEQRVGVILIQDKLCYVVFKTSYDLLGKGVDF